VVSNSEYNLHVTGLFWSAAEASNPKAIDREAPAVSETDFGYSENIPEELRGAIMQLCNDVAMLRHKWASYLDLYGSQEHTALLSDVAPAFFQLIDEALRNDIIMGICRLSDPGHTLSTENLSLATLVARCNAVPNALALLTAFQSAAGCVRLYRNRRVAHNDLNARIRPHEDPLPEIERRQIDEIIRLATSTLKAVYEHYCKTDLPFEPIDRGGVRDLVDRLRRAPWS
jgi:hypothetical protein